MEIKPEGLQPENVDELEPIDEINKSFELIKKSMNELSPIIDEIKKSPDANEKLENLRGILDNLEKFLADFNK
jgi:hypothetical protein